MNTIRTVADLRRALGAYADDLPVRFVSSESGGNWPEGGGVMVVATDEQIFEQVNQYLPDGGRRLMISLLLARKTPPT